MTKQPINKKKILHVIHILYDILSALFIVLVSGALIINACRTYEKAKDVLIPNVQEEYKVKRDAIVGDGRSVSFSNDFISSDFLTSICSATNVINDYLIDNTHTTKTIYVGEGYSGGSPTYPRVSNWDNINFNDMTTNGTEDVNWYYLNNIYIEVNYSATSGSMQYFILTIYFRDDLEDSIFHFNVFLWLYAEVFALNNNSFSFDTYNIVLDKSGLYGNFGVVYSNNRSLSIYLNAMSDDNYQKGYEIGKEAGYNIGFVDGSRGIESNAFTVIGQSFEAVSNIFSIEVLPSLPLWVLVFTPLIIAVVIVVVKLIKG